MLFLQSWVCGGLSNPSYWEGVIWGWLFVFFLQKSWQWFSVSLLFHAQWTKWHDYSVRSKALLSLLVCVIRTTFLPVSLPRGNYNIFFSIQKLYHDQQLRVHGGLCNPSYWDSGIWGWLEDRSPPCRLLVLLWRPHLAQDQFCTTRWVRVGHGGSVVVIRTPVRLNSNSAKFRAWVVLN